jgi:hypothetical protein
LPLFSYHKLFIFSVHLVLLKIGWIRLISYYMISWPSFYMSAFSQHHREITKWNIPCEDWLSFYFDILALVLLIIRKIKMVKFFALQYYLPQLQWILLHTKTILPSQPSASAASTWRSSHNTLSTKNPLQFRWQKGPWWMWRWESRYHERGNVRLILT